MSKPVASQTASQRFLGVRERNQKSLFVELSKKLQKLLSSP